MDVIGIGMAFHKDPGARAP